MKIWFENTPQRLSRDPQFSTTPSKRFLWTPSDWLPYFIDVSFCRSTLPPTGMSVRDAFRIKILHSTMLSKLLNPVKNSAFWWSISTPKLSPKICFHNRVWFVGKIGFHSKCLLLGRPGYVGEYYGPNFSCTESTSYPEKKKRLELNLWISVKNIWVWVGGGHPVSVCQIDVCKLFVFDKIVYSKKKQKQKNNYTQKNVNMNVQWTSWHKITLDRLICR